MRLAGRGLAVLVQSPTHHGAVAAQTAGVGVASTDRGEVADAFLVGPRLVVAARRRGLAAQVVAPATDVPGGAQPAGVPSAGADSAVGVEIFGRALILRRGLTGYLSMGVFAAARDNARFVQYAGMHVSGA